MSLREETQQSVRPEQANHSSLALPARQYQEELSATLKLRIAGAAFGLRKKERQKIDDVFLSIQHRQTMLESNTDEGNDISNLERRKPASGVGQLQKPNDIPSNFICDSDDGKGQFIQQ